MHVKFLEWEDYAMRIDFLRLHYFQQHVRKQNLKPNRLTRVEIDKVLETMQKVKIQRPPLDCLSPIGAEEFDKSLKREYPDAEFIKTITRDASVYRGFPFVIEAGIVYGGEKEGETVGIIRFANRVPLLYQMGACASVESIKETDWKRYGLQKTGSNLPTGPARIIIHMCSVWVPFISESKEAIAQYPEIIKEMKLSIQDAGRYLSRFISGKRKAGMQKRRMQIFERYAGEVAESLSKMTGKEKKQIENNLKAMLKKGDE